MNAHRPPPAGPGQRGPAPGRRDERGPAPDQDGDPLAQVRDRILKSRLLPAEFADEGGLADQLAQALHDLNDTKITQLRKVFDVIKGIRRNLAERIQRGDAKPQDPFTREPRLLRLMPALAFATGRKLIAPNFYEILKHCLGAKQLQTNDDFLRTADFIEAMLGYHKYRALEKKDKGGQQ